MKHWIKEENCLKKTFEFKDFETAIQFMQEASIEISLLNHHPEWTNIYNKVQVKLTTHDASNTVTQKDFDLAEILDRVFDINNPL
jgi:4a-hydroxytetrahydrobiopterin dehydratase